MTSSPSSSQTWSPHPGQREFLDHPAKIKVLACGRRWGKTDACAARILRSLFQPTPTRHVLIAPTLDQATILFDRVVEMLPPAAGEEKLRVRHRPYPRLDWNGHRVDARSGHLGRTLRGNEATDIVIDEAAFVPEDLITEVAMPMLATTNGSLTMISTPRGKNHFWRFFRMGQEGEHGIWSRHAPSEESPFVSRDFLAMQAGLISDRAFRVEYGAEFLDSAGRVFRTEAIDACLVSGFEAAPLPPFYVGVDWGRYDDFTAVAVVCGSRSDARLVEIERFNKDSWGNMVERVRRIVAKYPQSTVVCDGTGTGDALTEQLKSGLSEATVKSEVFTNAGKAKLIDNLAWIIENSALQMESHPELIREMQHFEAKVSDSGSRVLSGTGGYHDDLVIALALACRDLRRGGPASVRTGIVRPFAAFRKKSALIHFSGRLEA